MARRSQCSSAGDNPLDPNYLPPHCREEYRLAVDALVEEDLDGYYQFLLNADVVDFLSPAEIEFIQRTVRAPQHIEQHEQRLLEGGADGSSDTYWPLHSDLDAPGLDLGWPHIQHFIGPTEVTTLVNPAEPDMPSIKEQARRLIKNAQQVVAIVMDMFTDVDIFADILNAAMRNVAVYVLLDKENCHHFLNMAANCRVDLLSIQCLRVRTVGGITYRCRSGKSLQGQMMDRFLLTDCRAVLSGNYSFMWSFEKLHRCMAHLFLGQLVSTFDEEFRILFAQSEPLIAEDLRPSIEDYGLLQKRPHPSERQLPNRQPRKFMSLDTAHPDDWLRHSHEDRTDADPRMKRLKRQDVVSGGADVYIRYPSQQPRFDQTFDAGATKRQMMENPAFKRHSYAEGGHGRYSHPNLPGALEHEGPSRLSHRAPPQFTGLEREPDYSGYERFWNQDFHSEDQYPEQCFPRETDPDQDFDPVMNYLSSTRKPEFDQSSENLPADLPFSSLQQQRVSVGHPYPCQTSPTPSNQSEQKPFHLEPNTDRKDPTAKRGLRNWRINSYLSAYDNPGEEGLPSTSTNAQDPFEDPSNSIQQTSGIDFSYPKIPNVREFKIPAIPRASQMPSYAKTQMGGLQKTADEPPAMTIETKPTPTPSESSSTTEGEKSEEAEPKTLQQEDFFRKKHGAAVHRASRLRSSLIFSSLEQQNTEDTKTPRGQQDEDGKPGQKKLPYVSPVFGQRRSATREPFEWSRYIKSSATESKPEDENCTPEEKDKTSNDLSENSEIQETSKPPAEEKGNSSAPVLQPIYPEAEPTRTNQTQGPLHTGPVFVDMNDPDNRLRFFKELAAKRKAEKAAEVEKNKAVLQAATEPKDPNVKKKEEEAMTATEATTERPTSGQQAATVGQHVDPGNKTSTENNSNIPLSSNDRVSADLKKLELRDCQSEAALPVCADVGTPQAEASKEQQSNAANAPGLALREPVIPQLDRTSMHPGPKKITSAEIKPSEVLISTQITNKFLSPPEASKSVKETSSLRQTQAGISLNSSSVLTETCSAALSVAESDISSGSSPQTSAKTNCEEKHVPDSENKHGLTESPGNIEGVSTPVSTSSSLTLQSGESHLENKSRSALNETTNMPGSLSKQEAPPLEPHLSPVTSRPSETKSGSSSLSPEAEQAHRCSDSVSPPSPEDQTPTIPSAGSSDPLCTTPEPLTVDSLEPAEHLQKDSPVPAEDSQENLSVAPEDPQKISPVPSEEPQKDSVPAKDPEKDSPIPPEDSQKESPVAAEDSQKDSPVATEDSQKDSPVATEDSQKDSPVAAEDLQKDSPVPAEDSQKDSPVTAEDSQKDSPVPAEDSQKDSPVATEDSLKDSPVATEDSLQDSPVAAEDLQEDSPVAAEDSQKDSPVAAEDSQKDSPVAAEDAQKDSPVPTEDSLKDSPVATEDSQKDSPVAAEDSLKDSPVAAEDSQKDLPVATEDSQKDSPVAAEDSQKDSPVPAEDSQKDSPVATEDSQKDSPVPSEDFQQDSAEKNGIRRKSLLQRTSSQSSDPTDDIPLVSPTAKLQKSTASRYQSSTANVLSSSNLRDDTKLLLEQISANSQSRNEASKESGATDDEKEDENDKNGKKNKLQAFRTLRHQPKSEQEREKALERIQSMRKERRVYSRFEMAP